MPVLLNPTWGAILTMLTARVTGHTHGNRRVTPLGTTGTIIHCFTNRGSQSKTRLRTSNRTFGYFYSCLKKSFDICSCIVWTKGHTLVLCDVWQAVVSLFTSATVLAKTKPLPRNRLTLGRGEARETARW